MSKISKDEAVNKGYYMAGYSEYNHRRVLRDFNDDLYYSGWMDCFDWINSKTSKRMNKSKGMNVREWLKIREKLTTYLGICGCQRKLKSIIDCLAQIKKKTQSGELGYTGAEFLICALLESKGLINHGINCEYPILWNDEFWKWIEETANNPILCDN